MKDISDSFNDGVMKNVAPPKYPIKNKILFPRKNIPDWKALKTYLIKEGFLEESDIVELIYIFKNIIKNEPNIVKISDPVTVVGDLHSQFYDFIKCLEIGGNPENTKNLFLGDYVNGGPFSLLLFSLKINYSNSIIILRSNHECSKCFKF